MENENENKQQMLFKVRDLRKKDQFKIDDKYLNGYARVCGVNATLVYNSLCRHAEFHSQKAFPSQSRIAYQHGISVKRVRSGFKKLLEYNIIMAKKERIKGKFANYVYYLLDKSVWNTIGQNRPMVKPKVQNATRQNTIAVKPPTKDNKALKDNKDKNKDNKKKNVFVLKDYLELMRSDRNRHIQVIAVWIEAKGLQPATKEQVQVIIHRNLKAARLLSAYKDENIKEAVQTIKNTDWIKKFTLETVLKFIDDVVAEKKQQGRKIVRYERIDRNGIISMRPIYEKENAK